MEKQAKSPEYLAEFAKLPAELQLPEGLFYKPEHLKRLTREQVLVDKISTWELSGCTIADLDRIFREQLKSVVPEKPINVNEVKIGSDGDYDDSWLYLYLEHPETDLEFWARLKTVRNRIIASHKSKLKRLEKKNA